ncbi:MULTISPECIES: cytochrome P450 [Mycobacterium]|uniref:Cytochrome P450 n=1 Tax=Mycobacterium kiyosense TaxID=2871094 RepID=A0A9P3Q3L7_9MYCO|nr:MULTISPECIES: cytochrome P450 [Mycobacterium]BDB41304.1 cytochrome P450 [Mycobacterium kiyosense]BDE13059.1 cytochrome P450 [Mycobacterium sp. 20KCMC460]GLB82017.1 cytochrome P450 [Mycobacterium kiyosense]GLB89528.1 cytochrome P450 [Mycobacterium kiyosense]GLB95159.1 cytochrome P450 [Mycobacterium kiyosense]
MTATISTPEYVLDQARRRLTPSVNNIPGMGLLERRLRETQFPERRLAEPPPGSGLKPVVGDRGLPILGHMIEMLRGGPEYLQFLYETKGPLIFGDSPVLPFVAALGPDAAQVIYSNRNKDYSQQGWTPVIGAFFNRGLMLLDFEEHLFHRRIMQEAFIRSRLVNYVEQMDQVVSQVIADDWVVNDARFLLYPAMKELTLDIASMVFMGHEPGTDRELVTKVNKAFTMTVRAGNAVIRTGIPPFTWWRGLKARQLLEDYFAERVKEQRGKSGNDLLSVLCQTEDEDGNRFSDEDIVNHMIFLMMAAHDTSTTTATNMAYQLAANPDWQQRCRDESDRLGDGPLDIESLEKLESLDLVMNEAIRLVSPVQWAMRRTVRDTELLGHYIPAGTNVTAFPGVNHRLPELWTDPLKFDPDRFAEPRSEHKRHRYAFTPFGGGAHKCIGMTFGQLEIKTIMHRLLRRYRLELARPGYEAKWDYRTIPIPMDGMPIVLRPL